LILHHTTDKEFLLSIGVKPYDPEFFMEGEKERIRTRVLQAVAILQLAAMAGIVIWTL
jgi:hypothetical protein